MTLDLQGLVFILSAGVSALLSPCGFSMLPGYISYYLGVTITPKKAFSGGVACTIGLITVFAVIGVLASVMGTIINPYIPYLEIIAAIATIIMGISLFFEINIPIFLSTLKAPERKGIIGFFFYGIVYGLATLGCSAPIFFTTLFWAITNSGIFGGIITFLAYAIGMGLPLILTTVLVSMAKEKILKNMMKIRPYLQKISGVILITIGVYLFYVYYNIG